MPQDATAAQRPDGVQATGVQRPPFSAQRSTARPNNSLEGARPIPALDRRRSSLISDFSFEDARQSFRSSTDNLLLPKPASREHNAQIQPSPWHSAPLAFAILPAIGGLLFQNGSEVVTDVCLLALAAIFLNWSVRLPWEWYHAAQAVRTVEDELEYDPLSTSTIVEEGSEDGKPDGSAAQTATGGSPSPAQDPKTTSEGAQQEMAVEKLRNQEMVALALCFLGPILGTGLLHAIRSQLSRPSEGLVSNFNLAIFLLMAELRPSSHLISMMQARTLHLQRIARGDNSTGHSVKGAQAQDLSKRLDEVEARLADVVMQDPKNDGRDGKDAIATEVINHIRRMWQPQLDDLTRAVRRYEKRATTQTMQTEARLQDLENRLRDALALAAAAAKSGQKPGVVAIGLEWMSAMFMLPLQAARISVVYPLQLALAPLSSARAWLLGPSPDKRRRPQSKGEDHGAINGQRVQSKLGRR